MKCIGEFYGATEGNSNVLNIESKPGSVGFTSVLLPFVYPVSLIRIDEEGCPIRDENGLCIKCEPGEPGEFVGKIVKGRFFTGMYFYFIRLFFSALLHGYGTGCTNASNFLFTLKSVLLYFKNIGLVIIKKDGRKSQTNRQTDGHVMLIQTNIDIIFKS